MLPEWLRKTLPVETASAWEAITPLLPPQLYLVGGTAIGVHLQHRQSEDLDFFYHGKSDSVDLDELASALRAVSPLQVTLRNEGTLNAFWLGTKLQFLYASKQRCLEEPEKIEGLRVAKIADLLATKLKVIGERPQLRDYFDVMTIEERTGRTIEEGLGLFLTRYQEQIPADQRQSRLDPIIRGLGHFGDVPPDELVPLPKRTIQAYFARRQPEVVRAMSRFEDAPPPPTVAPIPELPDRAGRTWVNEYRRSDGTVVRGHYRGN